MGSASPQRFLFAYRSSRPYNARAAWCGICLRLSRERASPGGRGRRDCGRCVVGVPDRAGYESLWASDGTEALSMWSRTKPDVVILDILLPTISGLEVLRRRRASADDAAVIIWSARGEEEDRLVGLETGADDYLVKPFSPREVVLRVEALLRRAERLTGNRLLTETLSIGDVTIDLAAHVATRDGSQLSLTSREFDLLAFLAANPGQTFSKADLLRRVWGWDFGDTSTVTVHVRRLREKLEDDPSDPRIVLTVGRAGYRIARETELT
jgi:DNA-binding response OmpR family regulator